MKTTLALAVGYLAAPVAVWAVRLAGWLVRAIVVEQDLLRITTALQAALGAVRREVRSRDEPAAGGPR